MYHGERHASRARDEGIGELLQRPRDHRIGRRHGRQRRKRLRTTRLHGVMVGAVGKEGDA